MMYDTRGHWQVIMRGSSISGRTQALGHTWQVSLNHWEKNYLVQEFLSALSGVNDWNCRVLIWNTYIRNASYIYIFKQLEMQPPQHHSFCIRNTPPLYQNDSFQNGPCGLHDFILFFLNTEPTSVIQPINSCVSIQLRIKILRKIGISHLRIKHCFYPVCRREQKRHFLLNWRWILLKLQH